MRFTWLSLAMALALILSLGLIGCDDEPACDTGMTDCAGLCVNVTLDPNNCGGCGIRCNEGQSCQGGMCICAGPGTEACNNVDDNCNGQVDENLTRPCDNPCGSGVESCMNGLWQNCTAPTQEAEVCDGRDNDCDGATDEDVTSSFYQDGDSDRYGNPGETTQACEAPAGFVEDNTDCDDTNAAINPGAAEVSDGVDNNCDGAADEGFDCVLGSEQQCGEGGEEGECAWGTQRCIDEGGGAGPQWGDCEGGTRPAEETCDGLDNDCDGTVDDGIAADASESNDSCDAARGPLNAVENESTLTVEGTLYSPDGEQDEDWYRIHADETTHILCGVPWITGQCDFILQTTLTLPEGADPTEWEMCLNTHEDDTCSGSSVGEFCTEADDWNEEEGRYEFAVRWEGVCGSDDSEDFFTVIRRAGSAVVNDCNEYTATFQFVYTDEGCGD